MNVEKRLLLGLLLWILVTVNAGAVSTQNATVMFYSHGSTSGLPGANHGIFYGCVYDGTERLACFRDGFFVKNNLFVVFQLPAGSHVFSASYSGKHPAKNSQLTVNLEAGKTYFLRAQSESRGVGEIEWERGRIDEVGCKVAAEETATAKPLKIEHVSSKMADRLTQAVPPCP